MIALWMLYGAAVSLILCAAASAAERGIRMGGWPARGVWAAALAGALGLPLLAFTAGPLSPLSHLLAAGPGPGATTGAARSGLAELLSSATAAGEVTGGSGWLPAEVPGELLAALDGPLLLLWLALAGVLGVRLAAEWWRTRSRRRRWRRARLDGRTVLVAPDAGPALSGFRRPDIVVPEWFLELPAELRELALRHEEAHRVARDSWLILAAEVVRVLLPWNPGVHWAAARLRRAAELDCDRRLLRKGADRRRYGRLLLTVGGRAGSVAIGAMALTERTSDLKRRITMLRPKAGPWKRVRMVGAGALALAAVTVACETPVPPSEEAPPAARQEAADAEASPAGAFTSVEGTPEVDSRDAPLVASAGTVQAETMSVSETDAREIRSIEIRTPGGSIDADTVAFRRMEGSIAESPLVIVDGVIVGEEVMGRLGGLDIETIEVVKGEAARALYGERASDGVVKITTRGGG